MQRVSFFLKTLLCFSLFYVSAFGSWQVLSAANFAYAPIYDIIKIDEIIAKYAPQNKDREKRLLARTDKADRERMFGEITRAVNNGGVGLEEISFKVDGYAKPVKLLTEAEVLHLMDVSAVVFWFKFFGYVFVVVSLFSIVIMTNLGIRFRRPLKYFLVTLGTVSFLSLASYMLDLKKVFYFLHEVIFKENQWFFYYQESLMTVIMYAPVIFACYYCSFNL